MTATMDREEAAAREALLSKLRKYSRSTLLTAELRNALTEAFHALGGSDEAQ